jgi:signal transduction histidine kinase
VPSIRSSNTALVNKSRRSACTSAMTDLRGILAASRALRSETTIECLQRRVVDVLGALTGAARVHLVMWSDEHRRWLASAEDVPVSVLWYAQRVGGPLIVDDATRDERFARDPYLAGIDACSLLAVPVVGRGTPRAMLVLEHRLTRGAFSRERLDVVELLAGQLAVSLDNARLHAELVDCRVRIAAAGDQARRRVERDLHDGAQQRLVHTVVALKLAQQALGGTGGAAAELVDDALENAQRGMDEVRELARGIHPWIRSSGGLAAALEAMASLSPIPVTLDLRIAARLAERVEATAYYVVSEALANAAKHSNASSVHVTTGGSGRELTLSISDDGDGGADPARGSGLAGLKDRVEAVGGALTVRSPRGEGTHVLVRIALDAGRAAGRAG